MQGLKNKEQMFKQKYEKYTKILNRLMWLNACSSGISFLNELTGVDCRTESENRSLVEKSLMEEINNMKKKNQRTSI